MNGTTSDYDLKKLAKKLNIKLNGIYYKDELPLIPHLGNYIINLSSSNDGNGGTHWVCVKLIKENGIKKALYFDAFGILEPTLVNKFIMKWVDNIDNNIIRNKIDIQNLNSNYCGQYCLTCLSTIELNNGSLQQKLNNYVNEFRNYNHVHKVIFYN